jgi:predicted RNase H-like HicB family nuclease
VTHYIALVHNDLDSAFGVQFPDVPGCFSAADDMDDLISNATEALSLWAEDEVPPQPCSHEELRILSPYYRHSKRACSAAQ